jgi:hypothetical protein
MLFIYYHRLKKIFHEFIYADHYLERIDVNRVITILARIKPYRAIGYYVYVYDFNCFDDYWEYKTTFISL